MSRIGKLLENMNEAKTIKLPGVVFELVGFGRDTNGNSVVKLKNSKGKGFSIQTNGNLPNVHRMKSGKAKDLDSKELEALAKEVKKYIDEFGTKTMDEGLDEKLKTIIMDNGRTRDVKDAKTGEVAMELPRYAVWADDGRNRHQVIDTSNDVNKLLKKYSIKKEDIHIEKK